MKARKCESPATFVRRQRLELSRSTRLKVECAYTQHTEKKQDAQLSQRDRAAGCVIVFAKSRTLELGDNDLRIL